MADHLGDYLGDFAIPPISAYLVDLLGGEGRFITPGLALSELLRNEKDSLQIFYIAVKNILMYFDGSCTGVR